VLGRRSCIPARCCQRLASLLPVSLLCAGLLAGAPARAFTFFDGKLEVHGYVGEQIRTLAKNFNPNDGFDLAQWYNVLSVEVEAKPFPNGLGPLEILEFYLRAEARYDCVWTHACGLFPSVNAYGNNAEKLPGRLIDGDQAGYTGSLYNGDNRFYSTVNRENYQLGYASPAPGLDHEPMLMSELPAFVSLFGNGKGPNQQFEPIAGYYGDDPPPFALYNYIARCKFGAINSRGGENNHTFDILGPWNPSCPINPIAALRNYPNPFSPQDVNPILEGPDRIPNTGDEPRDPSLPGGPPIIPVGRAELPYRPAPFYNNNLPGVPLAEAQGLYVPSHAMISEIESHRLDTIAQNFGQQELAWNRGESQQETKEVKEAYADIEMFEGRLWLRLGKQTIVWGKTELFRNTDQFNPQDLALSTLPTLEESRISLWAARGSWSFYNIGKLEDVRLELALDLDKFEPADLGRCGEPFAVELVCGISFGYLAHGLTGAGLAGRDLPPNWWQSTSGLQGGGRLEWRYRRFSFQLSDYYGYDNFPYARRISTYERNVDPTTGRPRRAGATGPCATGYEPSCLGIPNSVAFGTDGQPLRLVDTNGDGVPDTVVQRSDGQIWNTGTLLVDPAQKADVLAWHPANQSAFAFGNILCGTAGANVDPALCGFAAFNGHTGPGAPLSSEANGASALIAGSKEAAISGANQGFICGTATTKANQQACGQQLGASLVLLNLDPGDNVGVFSDGGIGIFSLPGLEKGLGQRLTPQQEALFGCGPFYQDDCDTDGIDMLNAEASVLIQSWPGFDGTHGDVYGYDTRDASHPQPGTIGFVGGPVATRYANGREYVLPGARGVGLDRAHYDPLVDGCSQPLTAASGIIHWSQCANAHRLLQPFSGQPFQSELAAASWNFLMVVTAGGNSVKDPNHPMIQEFAADDPYGLRGGTAPVACGLYKPQLCATVSGFLGGVGSRRSSVRAAGMNGYGRRDFAWDSGGEIVLSYQKRNVLGFAFDFDEDRTKSNWGVEATWVNDQPFANNDQFDGISHSSTLNMTVSVDRPTFVNFINPGRTIFFNSQWFFQYIPGYHNGFWANGPLSVLATLTAQTGYHQDRLLVTTTFVYDFLSTSGGLLPSITYRFTENLSATVGLNTFFGRQQLVKAPINEIRPALNRVGADSQSDAVENGLSPVRDHDEIYMTLRYTF
jgi:hypothetical protein